VGNFRCNNGELCLQFRPISFCNNHKFVCLRIGTAFGVHWIELMKKGDKPTQDHLRALYLSKRDLIDIFDRALQIGTDYILAYAVSDNEPAVFDLSETRAKLGFNPRDNSQTILSKHNSIL
jgi:hypothetical protein